MEEVCCDGLVLMTISIVVPTVISWASPNNNNFSNSNIPNSNTHSNPRWASNPNDNHGSSNNSPNDSPCSNSNNTYNSNDSPYSPNNNSNPGINLSYIQPKTLSGLLTLLVQLIYT